MSRPLQSNQRDPVQQEHGWKARGHPGCHPALLAQGRAARPPEKPMPQYPLGCACAAWAGWHLLPFAGKPGMCRGTLGYSRRTQGCQEEAAWQLWADMCRRWAYQAKRGKVECVGRRVLVGSTGAACTWGAGEGMAPCRHRDGGACLWGQGWDSQRQDSDRTGQRSGLGFAQADPSAATAPQRLAGRCLPLVGL